MALISCERDVKDCNQVVDRCEQLLRTYHLSLILRGTRQTEVDEIGSYPSKSIWSISFSSYFS
jgi:hypothetical protein